MTLASLRSGVPFDVDAQLVRPARADRRPGNVSGRVQPPPQLADLLFQDRDGDAGGALDRRQHLPLRQRFQAGLDELPQDVTERLQIGRVGQRLRRGVELGERAQGRRRRRRLVDRRRIVGRRRALAEVVVEVVAVQRRDDVVGDAGDVQSIAQHRGGLRPRMASIGEDRHAADAGRPLPAAQAVGGERRPGRHAEDRLCRQRRLDALGDAEMTVGADRAQADATPGDGAQHLLARRRLARAVVEQKGAMDAADRLAVHVAWPGHHAKPAAAPIVVGKVRVEQQIRTAGIAETPALQVRLRRRSGERAAAVENADDLEAVIRLGWRRTRRRRWPIHPSQSRRFLEQRSVRQPGRVVDQVDRAGALAGGVIEPPTGKAALEMNDAGSLLARRPARQIGAAQGLLVGRQTRVRE